MTQLRQQEFTVGTGGRGVAALLGLALVLAASLLGGCGGGEAFRPAFAQPGESVIYVYRGGGLLAGGAVDVHIDQDPLARLHGGEYIAAIVQPGEHVVRVESASSAAALVNVPAGESAFLEVRSAAFSNRPVLERRPEEEAMEVLPRMRQSRRPVPE